MISKNKATKHTRTSTNERARKSVDRKRKKRGYANVASDPDALNFRQISIAMSQAGYKMNHSSARNYLLRAMEKIARHVTRHYDIKLDKKEIRAMARRPAFQDAVMHVFQNIPVSNVRQGQQKKPIRK